MTADDLYTLTPEDAHRIAMYGPLAAAEANGDQPPEGAFTLTVQTAANICAEPDSDTDQLLGPLVLAGGRTIIVGDTGEGKTTLAFQLIRTILNGDTFLDWTGIGEGRALIIDLEQGRKSVRRGLRDANLDQRNDVDLVLVPDGLSLDKDPEHLAELDRVIAAGGYTIVDLDPYYKAHRADEPNAERPIVDLMRTLDSLRARYGFALLLPAHPRKEQVGAPTVRKLTIHDIAGSGAVTRGAELVIGIERVSHGLARLRYLKDREGDLPIGEALNLLYTQADGFRRDPKDQAAPRDYKNEIIELSGDGEWRTVRDYMDALKAGDRPIRAELRELVAQGRYEYKVGPEGRTKTAKCWRANAAFTPSMQTSLETQQNTKENTALGPANAPDAPMQHKPVTSTASATPMHPNAVDAAPDFPREGGPTASGVSPVRGEHPDEVTALSRPELHSAPDADLAYLESIAPDETEDTE